LNPATLQHLDVSIPRDVVNLFTLAITEFGGQFRGLVIGALEVSQLHRSLIRRLGCGRRWWIHLRLGDRNCTTSVRRTNVVGRRAVNGNLLLQNSRLLQTFSQHLEAAEYTRTADLLHKAATPFGLAGVRTSARVKYGDVRQLRAGNG